MQGDKWLLPLWAGATLAPIHLANDAGGLDIHAVNAASAALDRQIGNAAYAATASQSSNLQGVRASSLSAQVR